MPKDRSTPLPLASPATLFGAVQFDTPAVTIAFDSDAKGAAASRKRVFGDVAANGALIGAAHLQFPGLGHLRAVGKSWQWIPVNYSAQLN